MKYTVILYVGPEYEEGHIAIHKVDAKNPAEAEEKGIAECGKSDIVRPWAVYKGHLKDLSA